MSTLSLVTVGVDILENDTSQQRVTLPPALSLRCCCSKQKAPAVSPGQARRERAGAERGHTHCRQGRGDRDRPPSHPGSAHTADKILVKQKCTNTECILFIIFDKKIRKMKFRLVFVYSCHGGRDCLDRPGLASAGLWAPGWVWCGPRVLRVAMAMCGNDGNTRQPAKRPKLGKPWPECGVRPLTGLTPRLVSVWLWEAA